MNTDTITLTDIELESINGGDGTQTVVTDTAGAMIGATIGGVWGAGFGVLIAATLNSWLNNPGQGGVPSMPNGTQGLGNITDYGS